MNERINHALAATANVERCIESVQNLLRRTRPCNGHGIYIDRNAVMTELMQAHRDLDAAWNALNTEWPTPADYGED